MEPGVAPVVKMGSNPPCHCLIRLSQRQCWQLVQQFQFFISVYVVTLSSYASRVHLLFLSSAISLPQAWKRKSITYVSVILCNHYLTHLIIGVLILTNCYGLGIITDRLRLQPEAPIGLLDPDSRNNVQVVLQTRYRRATSFTDR